MASEELTFVRHECLGPSTQAVIAAIGHAVSSLRARGWEIPQDASVRLRRSGFGYAAALVLPDRLRNGECFILQRTTRAISGVMPRIDPAEPASPPASTPGDPTDNRADSA